MITLASFRPGIASTLRLPAIDDVAIDDVPRIKQVGVTISPSLRECPQSKYWPVLTTPLILASINNTFVIHCIKKWSLK